MKVKSGGLLPEHRFTMRADGVNYFTPYVRSPLESYMTGVDLPNYKSIIASGGSAVTEMYGVRFSERIHAPYTAVDFNTGSYQSLYETNFYFEDPMNLLASSPFSLNEMLGVEADVRGKVADYVRQMQSPFQAQVFLGESREILQLLFSPLSRAKKLTEFLEADVRKQKRTLRNLASDREITRNISKLHLEYRFAILPLISDINQIMILYNKQFEKRVRNSFYSETSAPVNQFTASRSWFGYPTIGCDCKVTVNRKFAVSDKLGVYFEKLPTYDDLQSYLVSELSNISALPLTAWELTPGSFLVDYFVNVQDVINAATLTGIHVNYQSLTKIWEDEVNQEAMNFRCNQPYHTLRSTHDGVSWRFKKRTVQRTSLSGLIPPISVSLPTSGVRLANMAALLALSLTKLKST